MLHPKHTGLPRHHRIRCPSLQASFQAGGRKRLGDVEEAEKGEADKAVVPIGGAEEQGDPDAGYFVDDDELGVFAPDSRATMVAAGMPRIRAKATQTKRPMSVVWALGWRRNVSAAQRRNAATEPQVPGPGFTEAGAKEGGDCPGPPLHGAGLLVGSTGRRTSCHRRRSCFDRRRMPRGLRGLRGRGWGS